MTIDEKLSMIESVLGVESDTLDEATLLSDIPEWDSFAAMNLQIEMTIHWPDILFDTLRECKTIGDICKLCI